MDVVSQSAHPEPLPREQLRASDADRQVVAERLRKAHEDGRLTLAEYDERVQQAYAARTYGDLQLLTADLPAVQYPPMPAPQQAPVAAAAPRGRDSGKTIWRIVGSTWFAASLLNIIIWGMVCLFTGHLIYPWWIWVAGPWGAVLLVGWLTGVGHGRRR
jgi:Domain of unknown function (DUF1707)